MKKKIETAVVKTLIPILKHLPLSIARSMGSSLGWILGNILKIRREVVEDNIQKAFPEFDEKKIESIADQIYPFFTRAAVDWLRYKDVLEAEDFKIEGWSHIQKFQGQGAIIASAHLGYWELAASQLSKHLQNFTVYADRQSNPNTDQIIRNLRSSHSVKTVSGINGLRELVRRLEADEFIGLIGDQRPRNQFEYTKFFHHKVKNTRILSFLARKSQKPVIPMITVRTNNSVVLKIYPALGASLETVTEENRERLLREYNNWLEKRIREFPDQYFWAHKRWKNAKELDD